MGFLKSQAARIVRFCFWAFVATLPFTFTTILQATLQGYLFGKWQRNQIRENVGSLSLDINMMSWSNQFSVPGFTFNDWKDNREPYYLPELQATDWRIKLGLTAPAHWHELDPDLPVDKIVSFESAVRNLDPSCGDDVADEYWVYVSFGANPQWNPWDQAFLQLLEHTNMHPLPNGTRFAHIRCISSRFLCGVWQVRAPAFVHFLVRKDESVGEEIDASMYDTDPANLRPVEVRVIDLPLEDGISPVPPGRFPTEYEQMRSLVLSNGAYTLFDEYEPMQTSYKRFLEDFRRWSKQKGSFSYYVTELDTWFMDHLLQPLLGPDALATLGGVFMLLSLTLTVLAGSVVDFCVSLVQSFLARPTEFDVLAETLARREREGGLFGWPF